MKNVMIFAIAFSFLSHAALFCAEENLLQNPSFEDVVNGKPSIWSEAAWINDPGVSTFGVDSSKPHSGKNAGLIVNTKENHARFVQIAAVSENSFYKFSAWIRTENVGDAVLGAGIGVTDKIEFVGDLRKTVSEWKQAELYIKTGAGINTISVMLTLGTYGALNTGKAWFDDALLVKVDSIPSSGIVCTIESGSDKSKDQNAKSDASKPPQDDSKIKNGLLLFIIVGIIIIVGGACYLVIFMTLKKKKQNPDKSGKSKPGDNTEEKKD